MWIEEIDIKGFKALRSKKFTFSRGLTVVVGNNESGKSTLHEALMRSMFGYSARERRRNKGYSVKDGGVPWHGGQFGLNATFREVTGRSLRAEWNLDSHSLNLFDIETGEDYSSQVRLKGQDVRLGQHLHGMTLDDYREVCCLSQADIASVGRTESLTQALQKSVQSTSQQDSSVESALRSLNERRKAEKRRMDYLKSERDSLSRKIHELESTRKSLESMTIALQSQKNELSKVEEECLRVDHELSEADLKMARTLYEKSRNRVKVVAFAREDVDEARIALSECHKLDVKSKGLAEQVERNEERVRELKSSQALITGELESLVEFRNVDDSFEADVRKRLSTVQSLHVLDEDHSEGKIPTPDPLLEEFAREREQLRKLENEPHATGWNTKLLIAAAVVALISALMLLFVPPAALVGLLVAVILVYFARPAQFDEPSRDLSEALSRYGAKSVAELDERLSSQDKRIAVAEAKKEEKERQRKETEKRVQQEKLHLTRLLEHAVVPESEDLEERAEKYLSDCDEKRRLVQLEGRSGKLSEELAALNRPARDLSDISREAEEQGRKMTFLFAKLAIEFASRDEAEKRLNALVEDQESAERQNKEAELSQGQLETFLAGRTLKDLETQAERTREASRNLVNEMTPLSEQPGALKASLETLREKRQKLALSIREQEARLLEREKSVEDVVVLSGDLEEIERLLRNSKLVWEAVKVAIETLERATTETHRMFAPHLNKALEQNLTRITDGRYSQAAVGEDFSVSVIAPETGNQVSVENLSRGTQDQIFLIQRLEIAKLLEPEFAESPLLLDDPFGRFDSTRLRLGLEILKNVAESRQVIVFSEDLSLVALTRQICGSCEEIQLQSPSESSST